ncbi:MAG TPA: HD domain-containing protein [Nitrososphaera sp.]|nr:HD domain-containing protein [Nitrososphaera sp.]
MEFAGEITDPVHRYIRFSQVEKEVIDSPAFQRLRRIRQLAGAHLVYPSAQHSRFEHSLGAMHVAGLAGETLLGKGYIDHVEMVQDLRLGALLHDIGHGPFSHLFEEVLEYNSNTTHEEMGKRIIMQSEIADILARHGHSTEQVCRLSFGQSKVNFMNEIISGGLSADIMDYLPRDGLFTGAEYAKVDYHRLVSSLEVSKSRLAINKSALNSLESMLISRYEMFKAVYFHKTVRAAEVMLIRAMIAADEALELTDTSSLHNYLGLTDEATLERLCALGGGKHEFAGKMARDYRDRRLLKSVYEKFLHKRDRQRMDRKALQATASRIADAAGVDRNHVFVDASRAPSMPLTPSKEEMYSVLVVDKDRVYEMPVSELPLVESISGFFDMLRVYTTAENRGKVERSVKKVLGDQETLYMGAGKLGH